MLHSLAGLTETQRPLVGDKAMRLAQLIQQGHNVPEGFVLDGSVFRRVLIENKKSDRMLSANSNQVAGQRLEIERFAANMANDIITLEFPEDVITAIQEAWQNMGSVPAIVRPSWLGDVIPSNNTTGRPRSSANLHDLDSILMAVKLAWMSLWSSDAILYRRRVGVPGDGLGVAVILQRFVPGAVSGMLYTANPRNNRRDQLVIRSVWGLGESLVRDEVRPDHWVLEANGSILQANIPLKDMTRQPMSDGSTGTELVRTSEAQQGLASLESADISKLLALALQLQRSSPNELQLVEWTYYQRELIVLQRRPIVSMYPLIETTTTQSPASTRVYLQFNALLGSYDPMTPLGTEIWRLLLAYLFCGATGHALDLNPTWIKLSGGRLWLDITNQLTQRGDQQFLLSELAAFFPGLDRLILRAIQDRETSLKRTGASLGNPRPRLMMRTGFLGYSNPTKAAFRLKKSGTDMLARMNSEATRATDVGSALHWLEDNVRLLSQTVLDQVSHFLPGILAWRNLNQRVRSWSEAEVSQHLDVLQQELYNNPALEISRQLFYMANYLFESRLDFDQHREEMRNFVTSVGHHGNLDLDPGAPRWIEQERLLDSFIDSFQTMRESPERRFIAMREQALRLSELLPRLAERRGNVISRWETEQEVRLSRSLAGLRHQTLDFLARAMHLIRRTFLYLGSRLASQRQLSSAEDIFFLTSSDLHGSVSSLNRTAMLNQQNYEIERTRFPVPMLMLSSGEAFYAEISDLPSNQLAGIAMAPGEYTGYVRVVDDAGLAYVESGEILVLREALPQWNDEMILAGALVFESADRSSYTGIASRVFGVPSVIAVPNASSRLRTGMYARVDGNRGLVTVLGQTRVAEDKLFDAVTDSVVADMQD